MNTRAFVLSVTLLFAVPLEARDKTDVLVMNNGDRMTCEIKGLDAGVLYVSFDYIDGTASVDWAKVVRIESKQLFVVTTANGSVYKGRLHTLEEAVGRPVKIRVVETPEQEIAINQSQVVRMIATSDRFWQRFNGGISFGTSYSKGNQSTQYRLGAQTAYVRERWNALASYDSNLSSSTGSTVSTRNSLNLRFNRLLPWNRWFYSAMGGLLQSSEQGITLQSTLGAGVGRYLKNTDQTTISLIGGAGWQETNYQHSTLSPGTQNTVAALIYADARLFKFSKTNLTLTAALLPAVSDPGRVWFNTNASYYIKLIGNLKWNLSFYGNWDNRPPPGFSGSDYGTSAGLTWSFGLK